MLFCTLRTFSQTGGIEKVCRVLSKALYEIGVEHHFEVDMVSMYDNTSDANDNPYFLAQQFIGFHEKKIRFVASTILKGRAYNWVLLSHVNLLPVGWAIKKLHPSSKVILLIHGIEVWDRLSTMKRMMLKSCDQVWSVSEFTKARLISENNVPAFKVKVLNNCIDPFLNIKPDTGTSIRKLYGLPEHSKVLLTLTRLSASERRKGYLNVIQALPALLQANPDIYYLIAGKFDEAEKEVIQSYARKYDVYNHVKLTGFVEDSLLPSLFTQADVYVMPSKKEGFGIVFIEALLYGLPVIGGNADGTSDALKQGELGVLVNPDDVNAIQKAIEIVISNVKAYTHPQEKVIDIFGFNTYKKKLFNLISSLN